MAFSESVAVPTVMVCDEVYEIVANSLETDVVADCVGVGIGVRVRVLLSDSVLVGSMEMVGVGVEEKDPVMCGIETDFDELSME